MAKKKLQVSEKPADRVIEPFESKAVQGPPVKPARIKKGVVAKAKKADAPAVPAAPAPGMPLRKKKTVTAVNPFAEVATSSSPIAKAPRRTSSAAAKKSDAVKKTAAPKKAAIVEASVERTAAKVAVSPAFEVLADVRVPELSRENRARLQMQSPTRLHLYWSLKENPWAILRNVFGSDIGSYTLVLKLIDATRGLEEVHQCEGVGDRWFDVDANTEYRAEVGFYAPNRPYFRIVYSNSVVTPRRSPSSRPVTETQWRISADKFAKVLNVAGFSRDAFDVAMAGDDHAASGDVTRSAFFSLISSDAEIESVPTEDIRHAMLSIAAGVEIAALYGRISKKLIEILEANSERVTPSRTKESLSEHFDFDDSEFAEESFGPEVFGASVVSFPRTMKSRPGSSHYRPVSSSGLRR